MMLFLDNFDSYAFADIASYWTQLSGGSGDTSTIASSGRRSTKALQLSQDGSSNRASKRLHLVPSMPAPSGDTIIAGFAFRCVTAFSLPTDRTDSEVISGSSAQVLFACRKSGTTLWWARLNANGTISIFRGSTLLGSTAQALSQNVYQYLEFKVKLHASTGTVDVRIDGISQLSLTGQNTTNGGATTWDEIRLGPNGDSLSTTTWNYDDLYLADGSGSDGWADFMGDQRIDDLLPNGAGNSSDYARSTGADQFATIDDATANGDTDYNSTDTIGDKDTLAFPNVPVAGAVINGVMAVAQVRKTDAGSAGHKAVVRIGSTDYEGTERAAPSSYGFVWECWGKKPSDDTAWDDSDVNAAEFGYTKSS